MLQVHEKRQTHILFGFILLCYDGKTVQIECSSHFTITYQYQDKFFIGHRYKEVSLDGYLLLTWLYLLINGEWPGLGISDHIH